MTPDSDHSPLAEQAALFLAGALPAAEHRAFERRLAAGWPEAEAALAELEPAALRLAAAVPPVPPPARIRDELLARLPPQADPGVTFRFAAGDEFRPTPYPGVSVRMLHLDEAGRRFTALVRLAPGARYPAHDHDGAEECLVLDGELLVGGVRMRAGDYQRAEPGSVHAEQWSDTGATVYITAPASLLDG